MKNKVIQTMIFASIMVVSVITVSAAFVDAESVNENKDSTARYSETCAHGHNGFDCKQPSYRADISDLQKRVSALEERASRP